MNTLAVQLTGPGVGAIAAILVSGDRAGDILRQLAPAPRIAAMQSGDALHCALCHPVTAEKIDDAMIVRTGNVSWELHIHGGVAVVAAVLDALKSAGAPIVTVEDARRLGVFGAGIEGEIAITLPQAKTLTAARLLAAQLDAGLTAWSRHWQSWLAGKTPNDLWRLHSAAQWLLTRSQTLAFLLDPPRIAIIGPPNAGKSTLANALLGRPVAITSEIAGTTRDWVDAQATFIAGDLQVPVLLIDTAGVRETTDAIERESIARTHHQAHAADAIILLFDASRAAAPEDRALVDRFAGRGVPLVIAANKTDLVPAKSEISNLKSLHTASLRLSAKTAAGLDELMTAVLGQLDLARISPGEPFAFTDRQGKILEQLTLTDDPHSASALLGQLS